MIYRLQSRAHELLLRATLIFAFLFLPVSLAAQEGLTRTPNQQQAWEALNLAARAYREGNFAEAQRQSERALQLDPESRTAPMFIARTIHAQYKPGVETVENQAKAREAIDAYHRLLERTPNDEESFKAISYLYEQLKEDELQRNWVLRRAADSSIESDKRAEAYIVLASKDWDCSFKVTELPTSKTTTVTRGKAVVLYRMPNDPADFTNAQQCANRGLEMAELAIALAPENKSAWAYKANLLLEHAKLTEMSGSAEQKSEFLRQYKEALDQTTKVAEASQRKTEKPEREDDL